MQESRGTGRGAAMTAAQFETIGETEVEAILRWRFDVLVRAGYGIDSALVLASHVEIDLYEASELARRGCPSGVSVRCAVPEPLTRAAVRKPGSPVTSSPNSTVAEWGVTLSSVAFSSSAIPSITLVTLSNLTG